MSDVRLLSDSHDSDFPADWYEIASEGHFWLDWRFEVYQRQLRDLMLPLGDPWRGLDVGCGHGVVRKQIEAATRWTVDGADLHREALGQNPPGRGETYFYDVHDRAPELRERYDFIVLFDVIEHVKHVPAFLESTLHHLRPDGWLFVNVPAIQRMYSVFDRAVGHERRYDARGLRSDINAAGLHVRDVRYWGFAMLPYLAIRKLTTPDTTPTRRVIARGVSPPAAWMDAWIRRIMKLELRALPRPPLGTSILLAATKPERRS